MDRELPPRDRQEVPEGKRPNETFSQFLERVGQENGLPPIEEKPPSISEQLDALRKARTTKENE